MGQSLTANIDPKIPDGHFEHHASGSRLTIYRDAHGMRHRLEEDGHLADYPIAYSVGSNLVGRSFLIDLNGHLFQSPASYYKSKNGWDVSPGYHDASSLDFTRPIHSDCMTCHADSMQQRANSVVLTPISCDRCHGSPDAHLKNPVPGSIVNPAKLAIRERDSVCEQCHLEGATAVLNPAKNWSDFQPGMTLESVEGHFVFHAKDGGLSSMAAVSHAEQLAVSACSRASAGKLWCGTCHEPHGPPVADRKAQVRQICESCHAVTQLAATHSAGQEDCVACHMPRLSATDVAHAAITDHRILKRPQPVVETLKDRTLAAWQPLPAAIAERDLGLAYLHVARQDSSGAEFQRSYELLAKQPYQQDPEVAAALGYMLLGTNRPLLAIPFFEAATSRQPDRAEYWLDLGVAQQTAGHLQPAIAAFNRSIQADPYDYRPYKALSDLYSDEGQHSQSRQTLQQFLTLIPQSLTIRLKELP